MHYGNKYSIIEHERYKINAIRFSNELILSSISITIWFFFLNSNWIKFETNVAYASRQNIFRIDVLYAYVYFRYFFWLTFWKCLSMHRFYFIEWVNTFNHNRSSFKWIILAFDLFTHKCVRIFLFTFISLFQSLSVRLSFFVV